MNARNRIAGIMPDFQPINNINQNINQTTINITLNLPAQNSTLESFYPPQKGSKEERAKMGRGAFTTFIQAAMKEAVIERLEDGTFFAEIPPCPGVWADGKDEKECLATLQEVLEDWLLFKLRDGDNDIPVLGGADLNHKWQEDHAWVGENNLESGQQDRIN
ncbi:type II toxin-antitoxin system HicB family antitoxin [Neomoorella thermoacetica]|uniref:HicB-like antitoxin of toxin-antitoxin system domain-containing protein n=1 Tax=Neomoorella thermoacetica TaxID=1525 RepID=A0A1J5JU35_NEOTH|nr:type II toxin-antitoxin system HicB family antitoxin [Moorella thermoacetica]APC07357.1 hypothetical protein MTJW_01730 [Moorella thermoacetica]OIQ08095.1 hypothetical protein MOOR_22710 [Moorella thermoacetica]